jgi:thymidylate kinase
MLITFSGLDGSGKTTAAHYVSRLLTGWGYTIEQIHLIPWTWVNKIGRAITRDKKKAPRYSTARKPTGAISKILRLGMMGIDLIRFRVLLLTSQLTKTVIVCDRYFYDLGIQAYYSGEMSDRIMQTYWLFVPKPDHAFLLEVHPALAEQREGDHPPDYYVAKHVLYQDQKRHWPVVHVSTMNMKATMATIEAQLQDLNTSC